MNFKTNQQKNYKFDKKLQKNQFSQKAKIDFFIL